MKITLLLVGKTDDSTIGQLVDDYTKRLSHYVSFNHQVLPDLKKTKHLTQEQQKQQEGNLLMAQIAPADYVILLDEKGKQYSSIRFSEFIQKQLNSGVKHVVFVVGGPYGFSDLIYERSNALLSLSPMTFSHQMVRLFFTEQLYRAFTILKGEPYHHQ
ncbi:MAG: 23S rRNA (pseudouridine(1915)-N(3))-methyltransferase RlmH [Flavobacteriaceae bacterium]|jgi:23S rRNA (pseudouridine1915-N3)-methyltransferase